MLCFLKQTMAANCFLSREQSCSHVLQISIWQSGHLMPPWICDTLYITPEKNNFELNLKQSSLPTLSRAQSYMIKRGKQLWATYLCCTYLCETVLLGNENSGKVNSDFDWHLVGLLNTLLYHTLTYAFARIISFHIFLIHVWQIVVTICHKQNATHWQVWIKWTSLYSQHWQIQ